MGRGHAGLGLSARREPARAAPSVMASTPKTRWIRGAIAAAAAALPAAATIALADGIDTSRPRAVVVGAPRGFAPSERLDARRTGRARSRLPFPPKEAWRRHISGGVESPPVVDAKGDVLVALTVPEVAKLGADGKEVWRVRVGANAPLAPAVLTSDGTLALVSSAGVAWGLSPSGSVRFSTPLGLRGRDADVTPLALDDGGLVVAAGRAIVEVAADGAVRARAELPDRATGAILGGPEGALITTESGDVLGWRPPAGPRKLGSFGGTPRRGAALADERTLIAVVDGRRVVALDLPTGTTSARSGGSSGVGSFDAPPALGQGGLAVTTTSAGLLLGLDAAGDEAIRIAVDKPPPLMAADAGVSGFFAAVEAKPSPPVVIDRGGRVAFARAGGRVGVALADGRVALAGERVCSSPVAVVPAGDARMLVACRDGTLVMFEE